jgi:hypothetical protein
MWANNQFLNIYSPNQKIPNSNGPTCGMWDIFSIQGVTIRTKVFERYSHVENSVRVAVADSYSEGSSTRRIEKIFSKIGFEHGRI